MSFSEVSKVEVVKTSSKRCFIFRKSKPKKFLSTVTAKSSSQIRYNYVESSHE